MTQNGYFFIEKKYNEYSEPCVYTIFYTGFSPKSFVSEWSILYVNDNNTDICRKFDDVLTDVSVWTNKTSLPQQSVALKEIDLSDIFSMKSLQWLFLSFENYTQSITVDTYMALNRVNWKKQSKYFSMVEIPSWIITIWEWTIWENTFWESWLTDTISAPFMEKIHYNSDNSNVYKIVITGKNWSPFYITQLDIEIWFSQTPKTYFDPNHTI
jgi:hypothetical protein